MPFTGASESPPWSTCAVPAMNIIKRRIADNPEHDYLFQSVSPKNSRRQEPKPINRRSVTSVLGWTQETEIGVSGHFMSG